MSVPGPDQTLSRQFTRLFLNAIAEETSGYSLKVILRDPALVDRLEGSQDPTLQASEYAQIQAAFRAYFGNGARGLLNRIGHAYWQDLLTDGTFSQRTTLGALRALPVIARTRKALDFLAARLSEPTGQVSAHLIDRDLILMDQSSYATYEQIATEPICWATVGMIQAAVAWAAGNQPDVEELSCRAVGADACRFRIRLMPN